MIIEDACKIPSLWMDLKVREGVRVIGHKIGLTSRAMQFASKMTEPDYGRNMELAKNITGRDRVGRVIYEARQH